MPLPSIGQTSGKGRDRDWWYGEKEERFSVGKGDTLKTGWSHLTLPVTYNLPFQKASPNGLRG